MKIEQCTENVTSKQKLKQKQNPALTNTTPIESQYKTRVATLRLGGHLPAVWVVANFSEIRTHFLLQRREQIPLEPQPEL